MAADINAFLAKTGRPALVAQQCDSNESENVLCCQGPPIGFADEEWPATDGLPFVPVLSIHNVELPFTPWFLEGSAFWSLFIAQDRYEHVVRDGSLVVRKYTSIAGLGQKRAPRGIKSKVLPLRFLEVRDYPSQTALHEILLDTPKLLSDYEARADELGKRFPCHHGIKLGGYPYLIQETAFLKRLNPNFAVQIDSSSYFHYGDSGIGYFNEDLSYACWETL